MKNIYFTIILFVCAGLNIFAQSIHVEPTLPIVSNPISPIMGVVSDEKMLIDLTDVFSHPENKNNFSYFILANSFPEVAGAQIKDAQIEISFLSHGQTNIVLEATSHGQSVTHHFVVGVQPIVDGDYVVSHFENLELDDESFWNGADGSGGFESGIARFPNLYNPDWGSWSGWSYSNISDNTTPGWSNQYSAITGAGVNPSQSEGSNYAMAYNPPSLKFNNPSAHEVKGLFVTNSTYAALSMKYGDDFTKKFGGEDGNDPDWFKLIVRGMRNGEETEAIDFYLSDFRFDDNTKNFIIETWQWIDLSSLGKVDSLLFGLTSSDVGAWGMNTPSYFAIDDVYISADLAPFVANEIDDIILKENSKGHTISLVDIFTDPDDDDELIEISVVGNTNTELISAGIEGSFLNITPAENQIGSAQLTLQALSNHKTVTTTIDVIVESTTLANHLNLEKISVYPNPGNGLIKLKGLNNNTNVSIEVFNFTGQLVYKDEAYNHLQSIDLRGLPAGSFVLRLIDGKNATHVGFILQ